MTKPSLTIAVLMFMSCLALPQVPAKDLFSIHVTKVKRVDEGCIAEAESAKVRFKTSPAAISGPSARSRYQNTITVSENAKMIRPVRKKLTAIPSRERLRSLVTLL